jgi:hypothetical protein
LTIRTDTQKIGEYKLGVNTVARAAHADHETAFVSDATDPLANLDVVGTAWISGKTIENFAAHTTLAARTLTPQDHAFMVGGDSTTPVNSATLRVSTTNNGRVGVNTTLAEMQSAFTVKGTVEVTDNAVFQKDVAINGGGAGSSNAADVTTTITDGTVNLFMDTGFVGLTSGTFPANGLKLGGSAGNVPDVKPTNPVSMNRFTVPSVIVVVTSAALELPAPPPLIATSFWNTALSVTSTVPLTVNALCISARVVLTPTLPLFVVETLSVAELTGVVLSPPTMNAWS